MQHHQDDGGNPQEEGDLEDREATGREGEGERRQR